MSKNPHKQKFTVIGMTDNREVWFPPQVQEAIAAGRVFSGGKRHREIVEHLLPEGARWIEITVPLDANRRAFEYFSKNVDGFYENSKNSDLNLGWNFKKHPMTGDGMFSLSSFTNMKDVWSFFEPLAIHANWYDYLSGFAFLAGGAAYGQLGLLLSLGTAVAGFFNYDYL